MSVSVCRDIQLNLTTYDPYTRATVPVKAQDLSEGELFNIAKYLQLCTNGKRVEAMGRSSVGRARGWFKSASNLLYQTALMCFEQHLPFALRPEVLMHVIVHTCAQIVKSHAEDYRHLFTRSAEKQMIFVRHDGLILGNARSPWVEVMPMFERELRERVPDGIIDRMLPDFSTHTDVSRAASMVAFMDAASPYYGYGVQTLCGIPKIRMLGEAADWRKLCVAAAGLSEVFSAHLSGYFAEILPILATLAEQADGAPLDERFWASMYKYESRSGGDSFNGWLSAFIYDEFRSVLGYSHWQNVLESDHVDGTDPSDVPSQVCSVPFVWEYLGQEKRMLFLGGVLAVDNVDGYATPALSFAVVHDE